MPTSGSRSSTSTTTTAYDSAIREKLKQGKSGEALFFELALEDIMRAADIFRPIHDRTNSVDGWTSLEVSPLLAHDTASTLAAAIDLYSRAGRPDRSSRFSERTKVCPRLKRRFSPALKALADYGELVSIMPADGGDCETVLAQFAKAELNIDTSAAQLQDEDAKSFVKSWNELMGVVASKSDAVTEAAWRTEQLLTER